MTTEEVIEVMDDERFVHMPAFKQAIKDLIRERDQYKLLLQARKENVHLKRLERIVREEVNVGIKVAPGIQSSLFELDRFRKNVVDHI